MQYRSHRNATADALLDASATRSSFHYYFMFHLAAPNMKPQKRKVIKRPHPRPDRIRMSTVSIALPHPHPHTHTLTHSQSPLKFSFDMLHVQFDWPRPLPPTGNLKYAKIPKYNQIKCKTKNELNRTEPNRTTPQRTEPNGNRPRRNETRRSTPWQMEKVIGEEW